MQYKKHTLPNGLRVITTSARSSEAVTVMVLVRAGSDYENKEINGLSHFLEHMCFQGTKNRPNTGDVSRELDSLGAESNAFTGKEYTGYWAKAHNKHLPKLIDIVSDIYLNPVFNKDAMEREKGVVIEEMKMYEDMPHMKVGEVFESLMYGDQPAGWPIIGNEKNVRALTQKDLEDYRNKHYTARNTLVVVSGNFNEKEALKLIKKAFKDLKKGTRNVPAKTKEITSSSPVKIFYKETDQAHLVLGFKAFDIKNKKNDKLSILDTVLGKGMSSRLFKRLRDELGLCYYVRSGADASADRGYFAISTGVAKDRIKEAIQAVLGEIKKILKEEVNNIELLKAKELKVGNMYLSLETSDAIGDFYAYQELFDLKVQNPDERAKTLNKVTAKEIRKIAEEVFDPKTLRLAIVGPYKNREEFEEILKF